MTIEEAAELMDNPEYVSGTKNLIPTGLTILSKYCDDITVTAEHDEIWAYTDDFEADLQKMSKEDIEKLAVLCGLGENGQNRSP